MTSVLMPVIGVMVVVIMTEIDKVVLIFDFCQEFELLLQDMCIRVTLISKLLEFPEAEATTSKYMSSDFKTGFRFSLSQK